MVARLERAGLVRREPNPRDARGVQLFLTAKGQGVRADARPVFRRVIAEMSDGFSDSELEVVYRFLHAVAERCGSDADPDPF